jgi:hypothetical protein
MAFPGQVVPIKMNHNPVCVLNQYDGVPFITPIREPIGTCASAYWHGSSRGFVIAVDRVLIEYTQYLENISTNFENLYVVRFTDLINNVSMVIDGLVRSYPELSSLKREPVTNDAVIRMLNYTTKSRYTEEEWATQGAVPRPAPTYNESYKPELQLLDPAHRKFLTKAQEAYWKVLQQSYSQI